MMDTVPRFVVVGRVNKGKSSLVATLAEDDSVPIEMYPGTTEACAEFSFRVAGKTLFTLVDTPGFQEARHALDWMQKRSRSVGDRQEVVRAFVEEYRGSERFVDEVRLLEPVLEGAGILYVVDGSRPFREADVPEMEILRWTGQPGMALINRTRDRDHSAQWRPILEQFFNVVRAFDTHRSRFVDRMNLLRGFREIRQEWRGALDRAIECMEQEWRSRVQRSAVLVAELMAECLGHVEKREVLLEGKDPEIESELKVQFESTLRRKEQDAREKIERLYNHRRLNRSELDVEVLAADLFSDTAWQAFGLTLPQLAKYGAAWGAAIGAAVDLMVGGLSFFAGALVGAASGAAGAWFLGDKVAKQWGEGSKMAKLMFPGDSGHFQCMGPVTNPRFAWILLDRALVHFRVIRDRAHARQDQLDIGGPQEGETVKEGIVAGLGSSLRDPVDKAFREILKSVTSGTVSSDARRKLATVLVPVMESIPEAKVVD